MTRFVRASVTEGMFPHERSVSLRLADGKEVGLFAHETAVGAASVRVELLDENGACALVRLPGEVYGAGNVVSVRSADVMPE